MIKLRRAIGWSIIGLIVLFYGLVIGYFGAAGAWLDECLIAWGLVVLVVAGVRLIRHLIR